MIPKGFWKRHFGIMVHLAPNAADDNSSSLHSHGFRVLKQQYTHLQIHRAYLGHIHWASTVNVSAFDRCGRLIQNSQQFVSLYSIQQWLAKLSSSRFLFIKAPNNSLDPDMNSWYNIACAPSSAAIQDLCPFSFDITVMCAVVKKVALGRSSIGPKIMHVLMSWVAYEFSRSRARTALWENQSNGVAFSIDPRCS